MSELLVTNLSDDPLVPESLPWCVNQAGGPHSISAAVEGNIYLTRPKKLKIRYPGTTVDFSGSSLQLYGAQIQVAASDVTLRGIRHRGAALLAHPAYAGWQPPTGPDDYDVLQIGDPDVAVANVTVDHCSFSGSFDEVVNVWHGARNVRLSRCLIVQGYDRSPHSKSPHSMAALSGNGATEVDFVECVLASSAGRLPQFAGGVCSIRESAIYGWRDSPVTVKSESNGTPAETALVVYSGGMVASADSSPTVPLIRLDVSLLQGGSVVVAGLWTEEAENPLFGWSDGVERPYSPIATVVDLGSVPTGVSYYRALAVAGARPLDLLDAETLQAIATKQLGIIDAPGF